MTDQPSPGSPGYPSNTATLSRFGGLAIQRLDFGAGLSGTTEDWAPLADLGRRALDPNIFHDPALVDAATGLVGPVSIVAIAAGGRLLAALPVHRRRAGFGLGGALPHVLTHRNGPLGTPAVDPELAPEDLARLIAAAIGQAPGLVVPFLDLGSATAERFAAAAACLGTEAMVVRAHHRAALDATQSPEAFHAALSGKRRKEWGRLERRLGDLGTLVHDRALTPVAIDAALDDVLALEAKGWKGRNATALLHDSQGLTFARDGIARLKDRGQVRIDRLILGGQTIAGLISFLAAGRVFIWKTAYDEDQARFSPGVLLMLKATADFLADPTIAHGDSLAVPGHPMIEPIWPERARIGTMILWATRSEMMRRLIIADIRLYDQARAALKRLLKRG